MWALVPQPGTELVPLAVEAWSLNHWTISEEPGLSYDHKMIGRGPSLPHDYS